MSSTKTNKSFTKRLKITKNGKILAGKGGGNHFNAKESRSKQLNRKRGQQITFSNKIKNLNLPHHS
jgi:ribosomal protein L35